MGKIYITSDLHFGHDKDFLYKPRGFNCIEDHDEAIINNWNSCVTDEDDVFVLGDLMLGDNEHGIECINRLNGKIHIITGNHDTDNRLAVYRSLLGKKNIYSVYQLAKRVKYRKYNFYLSHYPTLIGNYDIDKPLRARVINLCGHTHTKDKWQDFDYSLIYHVELDAHNNHPVLLDTIIDDIKERLKNEKLNKGEN